MQRHQALYFSGNAIAGRGVFCSVPLQAGDLLEICPVIVLEPRDRARVHDTFLHDYYFSWGEDESWAAIALGLGSLFNHSENPNVGYEMHFEERVIDFFALTDIAAHEELFIDYTQGDRDALWF